MQSIQDFLAAREIAVVGVSRDSKKFGYLVFTELMKKGYNLYPVNPNAEFIDNQKSYAGVNDLPEHISHLYIVTGRNATTQIMKDAISKGIRNIWIQQKSDTPEAIEMAKNNGIKLVYGECILMYTTPVASFHKFHRFFRKLFGSMPK